MGEFETDKSIKDIKPEKSDSQTTSETESVIDRERLESHKSKNPENEKDISKARKNIERIEEGRTGAAPALQNNPDLRCAKHGQMRISVDLKLARKFLTDQGLTKQQAQLFEVEFGTLKQSNQITRFFARFLPGRLKEIFTRIESLKGNKLKFFTNNLESIYEESDKELILRDTIHHLAHFAQRNEMGKFKYFLTRLPIIHGLSKYEKDARRTAREIDIESWVDLVEFSNGNKNANTDRLKNKI